MELYLHSPSPLHGMKLKLMVFIFSDPSVKLLTFFQFLLVLLISADILLICYLYRCGMVSFNVLYLCISQQLVIIVSITILCDLFTMHVARMQTGTKYWVWQVESLLHDEPVAVRKQVTNSEAFRLTLLLDLPPVRLSFCCEVQSFDVKWR